MREELERAERRPQQQALRAQRRRATFEVIDAAAVEEAIQVTERPGAALLIDSDT
jgi:hypothetical protein